MPPAITPIGKAFAIHINGTQIATVTSLDANYIDHVFEIVFNATTGTVNLEF